MYIKSSVFAYVQRTKILNVLIIDLCRYMDSAKLPYSSIRCREWCVSTNTTVLSDQVKKKKKVYLVPQSLSIDLKMINSAVKQFNIFSV